MVDFCALFEQNLFMLPRGGSSVGARGAQAPLPPETPWKVEARRREKKGKEKREEEERGAGGRRREMSPPRANRGSATDVTYINLLEQY